MHDLPYTILIVDDSPANLFTLEALLQRLDNCKIVQAGSGWEALAATLEHEIDLILLDIQMPTMDGYETAQHLKMTVRTRNIPIIFVTAVFKSEEFIKHGYEVGAVDYLTKPLDDNLLLNRIAMHRSLHERELALHEALEKLRQSSQKSFRDLFEGSMDAITIADLEHGLVDCNARAVALFGYSDKLQLLNKHPGQISPPSQPNGRDSVELANELIQRASIEGNAQFEWVHQKLDGTLVTVDILLSPINWNGRPCVQASLRDITDRKQAESKLQLAASVFTHAREGITITDASGTMLDVNDTFSHITGYSRAELIGQNPRILRSGRQSPEFYKNMWQKLIKKGYWTGEVWNRRKNGEVYAEMLTISAVHDAGGKTQNYVALVTDITPIKEHQQQLEHIAHYDALTSLPNRILLADRLKHGMIQCERHKNLLAVVYLDLDGFKAVNDTYGHDTGDELLITVSQRMKAALREGDTLARIGGDEFVAVLIVLEHMSDCEQVLSRLLEAAACPVTLNNVTLQVSASIGVALYPQDKADADLLMRHADQAMYIAKQAGKNRYHFFDVEQDVAIKTQRESIEGIRHALEQNEFVLYYQPQVNMKNGEVIGAEALIRWQHPERGLLPPAEFLPIIELHPLSVALGNWVIDSALTQMSEWQKLGLNIPVSVNIGACQLQQDDFVAQLSALLNKHPDVTPDRLELEILETSTLEDINEVSAIMHACREIGVRFALDDFGTGYSSLTYLRRLPADLLKIDQSFVRDMLVDPDDLAIINGVIGLATAFQRQVIAEGVETVAHGKLLLSIGCELAQGYGIARPMPSAELPGWAATWRPDSDWTK